MSAAETADNGLRLVSEHGGQWVATYPDRDGAERTVETGVYGSIVSWTCKERAQGLVWLSVWRSTDDEKPAAEVPLYGFVLNGEELIAQAPALLCVGDVLEPGKVYTLAPGTVITDGTVTGVRGTSDVGAAQGLEIHTGPSVRGLQLWYGINPRPL